MEVWKTTQSNNYKTCVAPDAHKFPKGPPPTWPEGFQLDPDLMARYEAFKQTVPAGTEVDAFSSKASEASLKDDDEGEFFWYLWYAENGSGHGAHSVAHQYLYHSEGVIQPDPASAAHWYRLAARRGFTPSATSLGELYEEGNGVPADKDLARALYAWAHNSHDSNGADKLATMYWNGDGVERDRELATCLLEEYVWTDKSPVMAGNLAELHEADGDKAEAFMWREFEVAFWNSSQNTDFFVSQAREARAKAGAGLTDADKEAARARLRQWLKDHRFEGVTLDGDFAPAYSKPATPTGGGNVGWTGTGTYFGFQFGFGKDYGFGSDAGEGN